MKVFNCCPRHQTAALCNDDISSMCCSYKVSTKQNSYFFLSIFMRFFLACLLPVAVFSQVLPRDVTTFASYSGGKQPTVLSLDNERGLLYVSGLNGNTILRVYCNGSTTLFVSGLNSPWGLALHSWSTLLVAEFFGNRILNVSTVSGQWTVLCGNGLQRSDDGMCLAGATFHKPNGIAVKRNGDLIVSQHDGCLRVVALGSFSVVWTIATNLGANNAVALDSNDNAYVTDHFRHCIRRVNVSTNATEVVAGSCGVAGSASGFRTSGQFFMPSGISYYASRDVFLVTERDGRRILAFAPASRQVTTIAGAYSSDGYVNAHGTNAKFKFLYGSVVIDEQVNKVYVPDGYNDCVRMPNVRSLSISGSLSSPSSSEKSESLSSGSLASLLSVSMTRVGMLDARSLSISGSLSPPITQFSLMSATSSLEKSESLSSGSLVSLSSVTMTRFISQTHNTTSCVQKQLCWLIDSKLARDGELRPAGTNSTLTTPLSHTVAHTSVPIYGTLTCNCQEDELHASSTANASVNWNDQLTVTVFVHRKQAGVIDFELQIVNTSTWLPLSSNAFHQTVLHVSLWLSQKSDHWRQDLHISVEARPYPFSVAAKHTATSASWGSLVSFTSSSTLSRVSVARSLLGCYHDVDDGSLLPTMITLPHNESIVVNNFLLVAASVVLLFFAAGVYSLRMSTSLTISIQRVSLPSAILFPWLLAFPTTAVAVARLAAEKKILELDVALFFTDFIVGVRLERCL